MVPELAASHHPSSGNRIQLLVELFQVVPQFQLLLDDPCNHSDLLAEHGAGRLAVQVVVAERDDSNCYYYYWASKLKEKYF